MSQVTVLDELYFGPANLNRHKEEILAAAQSVMELLDLAKFRDRSPFQLSGGEQQRVAIARTLAQGCNIILADEPTGNLDGVTSREILSILRQLHGEGQTIVMITHDDGIAAAAPRQMRMESGRLS